MHLTTHLLALSALAATTTAIQCTSPPPPNPLNLCNPWQVKWTSVDTDPPSVCIYLSNFGLGYPPSSIYVSGPVNTNLGSVSVPGKCFGLHPSSRYRIRIAACGDPDTIYSECGEVDVVRPQSCCSGSG
ncbi:uncharacterized protein BDV14DRAFT_142619 [Aspergillus stella-maris]|uniref:uncharacterized protein n=1 Tax=Aspergillus stella-maris TaxID=1810926 RepID=UPI003CCDB4CC